MGHSSVRAKVRRRKVAHLAAYSRQFTVKNNTVPKSELNQKKHFFSWDKRTQFGKFEINTFGHLFSIDKDGYHLENMDCSWPEQKHKQSKNLRKKYKKKYYNKRAKQPFEDKGSHEIRKIVEHPSTFPVFICKKMTQQEYWEKLVQHKLERWERKNPCPIKNDEQQEDLFKAQFLEPWKKAREKAEERFRDFVVSIYDKLPLSGRFKTNSLTAAYMEKTVAELKDINGEGHHVNELGKDSKLLKKAQKVTNKVHAKHANLVCTNLKDHKRQKGRIILPQAA